MRVSGFIVTMPVIGSSSVPNQVKILLALSLTVILFPTVGWQKLNVDFESLNIVQYAIKEVFIGLTFGFLCRTFFMTIMMAGQIMSITIGISSAQLYNPMLEETVTPFDQFYSILATLFFLAINGHHLLINGIVSTFELIPIIEPSISLQGLGGVTAIVTTATTMAVQISAPILVSILMMNLAMALVGRAVPQINILMTSIPITTLTGLAVMFITMPVLFEEFGSLLHSTTSEVFELLKTF
jgi:flagellar biosynthetic protein FliR